MSKDTTTVETVDMDLDSILSPGDSVMLPSNSDKAPEAKANIFSRNAPDLSFLDKPAENDKPEDKKVDQPDDKTGDKPADKKVAPIDPTELDTIINDADPAADDNKKSGRPKTDKDGLLEKIGRAHV